MGKTRRKEFGVVLKTVLGSDNVYYQPGPDAHMNYPCIVYERDDTSAQHADNLVYRWAQRYQVTHIDKDPDSDVIDKLTELPLSAFSRHFATSDLNHDVFVIYH